MLGTDASGKPDCIISYLSHALHLTESGSALLASQVAHHGNLCQGRTPPQELLEGVTCSKNTCAPSVWWSHSTALLCDDGPAFIAAPHKGSCYAEDQLPQDAEAGTAQAAQVTEIAPAPGLGQAGRPPLERTSAAAARPIGLRRSASFGMQRPGSGAGSFGAGSMQRSHSYIARHRSFRDISTHSTRSYDSTEEPLLQREP